MARYLFIRDSDAFEAALLAHQYRPRVVSAALAPALEALRLLERVNGPVVLIERPRQGCTVVSTEPVPSPIGTNTMEAGAGAGASEEGNDMTGEVSTPPASPEKLMDDLGPEYWQCPICHEDRPQSERV